MKNQQRTKALFPFIWKTSQTQIVVVVFSILVGVVYYLNQEEHFTAQWHSWIHAYITVATFVMAIFIWYNEKKEEWEKHLSKKLDIVYLLDGKPYATVKNAPLAGEDDIRQWGQSIGQTNLNGGDRIDFNGFKVTNLGVNKNKQVMHYELIIYLGTKIKGVQEGAELQYSDDGNLLNQQGLIAVKPAVDGVAKKDAV